MSILSDLLEHKITFSQAVTKAEAWWGNLLTHAPPAVQSGVAQAESDFKQAAGNAVALADTALGPLMATATVAVNTAVNGALTAAMGGAGAPLIPAVDAGIDAVINGLHAEIDAVAAEFRAKLVTPAATPPAH